MDPRFTQRKAANSLWISLFISLFETQCLVDTPKTVKEEGPKAFTYRFAF